MTEESVFEDLRKRKPGLRMDYNITDRFDPNEGPLDDIGGRIIREYEQRNFELGEDERNLAIEYFWGDYKKSQYSFLKVFEMVRGKGNLMNNQKDLMKASRLAGRIETDLAAIGMIDGSEGAVPQIVFATLQNYRTQLYFMFEFPSVWADMFYLHFKRDYAVSAGDYKEAAICRDKIRDVINKASKLFS